MAQQPLVKRRIPVNFAPRTRQDFLVLAVLNQRFVVCRNGARAGNDRKSKNRQAVRAADRSFRQCFQFGIHRVRGDLPEAPGAVQLHQELLDGQDAPTTSRGFPRGPKSQVRTSPSAARKVCAAFASTIRQAANFPTTRVLRPEKIDDSREAG